MSRKQNIIWDWIASETDENKDKTTEDEIAAMTEGMYFGLKQMEVREKYMFAILSNFFGVELKTVNL